MCITGRYNMDLVYIISIHIQNFIKIHPFVLKILRKNTFLHQSRAITLLFIIKFGPFTIPNHTSDINVHAKFDENQSKTTQARMSSHVADFNAHNKQFNYQSSPTGLLVS